MMEWEGFVKKKALVLELNSEAVMDSDY